LDSASPPARSPIALVAVDDGPRSTLAPVAAALAADLAGTAHADAGTAPYWMDEFSRLQIRLLVVGTSNSARGRLVEGAARLAAARVGVPVAAIEDYPGNYFELPGCATRLLVVESAFSEQVYRARPAVPPPMIVIPPARYDGWRGRAHVTVTPRAPYAVLWAGQPETQACVETLEWLIAELAGLPARLLLRAHPRDPARGGRVYRDLFTRAGIDWLDVSGEPVAATLARRIDLAVTQFSSVAVDAGFAGVPSLHVLLPQAGGLLLRQLKGYGVPAICDARAAFLATGGAQDDSVRAALLDAAARERVMARFHALYGTAAPTAQLVAAALHDIML
jgi:hypothetical protein